MHFLKKFSRNAKIKKDGVNFVNIMVIRKLKKTIFVAFLILFMYVVEIYAANHLKGIKCPNCGEKAIIVLSDDEGLCKCDSCDNYILIQSDKIITENEVITNILEICDEEEFKEEYKDIFEKDVDEKKKEEKEEELIDDTSIKIDEDEDSKIREYEIEL